ncbi:MAG: protein kinase [Chloroflexi bacterium]|nr:protein kinase [Chloroflexota bacterium]
MSEFSNTLLGNRYQIRERIGAGGMARVFKAWDTVLERAVAVKILYEHLAEDATFQQRFEREAKAVASFNHPNIVQIFDFDRFERDGQTLYYMVMAYIPGKTLKNVLDEMCARDERLSLERIEQIMTQLLDAVGYAHAQGAIHRDIKPGNILFNERGQAILTDFGIARLAQGVRLTRDSVTVGTPAYMSPEQAVGGAVDARSDLYALGIMLYEMLTGKVPFDDDGSLSVLFRHINDPIPSALPYLSMGSEALDIVLLKALAKDPDQRYASAEAFAADLQAAFAGKPVLPPKAGATADFSIITGPPQKVSSNPVNRVSLALNTITRYIPPTTRRYAPLGIFIVGMVLIGVLVGASLVNNQLRSAPPAAPTEAITGSMTGNDAESMTSDDPPEFESTFAPDDATNSWWPLGESTSVSRMLTPDGFLRFVNHIAGAAMTTILDAEYNYDFVSITLIATLDAASPPTSGYGIVFRYQDNDHYNVFAVDGRGRYSIWVRDDGQWTELRRSSGGDWTPNDAVLPIGSPNRLTIRVQGNLLTGQVNGTQVAQVTDSTLEPGRIGIYLATPENASEAVLLVDAYGAVPSVPTMTESSRSGDGR